MTKPMFVVLIIAACGRNGMGTDPGSGDTTSDASSAAPDDAADPDACCLDAPLDGNGVLHAGVKWHPGHYAESDQNCTAANSRWPLRKAEIDLAFQNPNVQGYMDIHWWSSIENATAGSYNWTNIDQARDYIATNYPGKRYGVMIEAEDFSHTDPSQVVPAYVLNDPQTYGAGYDGHRGGYWQLGSYGSTALWGRPAIATRVVALVTALAHHTSPYGGGAYTYDTDPYFETVTFSETALDLASAPPDYNVDHYRTAWNTIVAGTVAAFPHTNVLDQNNFFAYTNSSATLTGNVELDGYNAHAALSTPDVYNGITNWSWGQQAYVGYTGGFSSLAGKAPYIAQVQSPDWNHGSGAQLVSNALDAAPNGLQASHIFWMVLVGGSGDWGNVSALIDGHPIPTLNQTCPTAYGGCVRN